MLRVGILRDTAVKHLHEANIKSQKKLYSDCITRDFTFLLQGKSYIEHDLCGTAHKTIWNSSQQIHNQRKALGY